MNEQRRIIAAFTEMAPEYENVVNGELQRFWGWSYNDFVDQLLAMTPIGAGDAILDVATGSAVIPLRLSGQKVVENGRMIGLDITFAMLKRAKERVGYRSGAICLVCASAMQMPFCSQSFDVVTCALATHHMDVPSLLSEMRRVLRAGGRITIADVAGSPAWRLPMIKALLRGVTFLYFLPGQGLARAIAEANALFNIRTVDEWQAILLKNGFSNIQITHLASKYSWLPDPLIITAVVKRETPLT